MTLMRKGLLFFAVWAAVSSALPGASADFLREKPARARILFTGDLMTHQPQIDAARTSGGYSFAPSFEAVKKYISAADLAVGNFETTLGGGRGGYTGYPCFSVPDAFADAVADAGFDALTTANNHCMDRRFWGLKRTVQQLRARSMDVFGTYLSRAERESVLVKDVNGIKIALLSWTYGLNGFQLPKGKEWAAALLNDSAVSEDMARARALSPDYIVACVHMGTEYVLTPPQTVVQQAEKLVSLGADAVIASHPHVLQPVEWRASRGGGEAQSVIAWSMGNFISNQRTVPRDMGMMLELELVKSGDITAVESVRAIPTWVQTRLANGKKQWRVLPLTEALRSPDVFAVRRKDLKRLREAHADFTRRVLSRDVSVHSSDISYDVQPSQKKIFTLEKNSQ
ncbi:MAG: CapA family protein [Pyramidobacter sp.]|nr:CapA family protein [Pyramidobacter sp.]